MIFNTEKTAEQYSDVTLFGNGDIGLLDTVNTKIVAAKTVGVTDAEIQALANYGRIAITTTRIADITAAEIAKAKQDAIKAVETELLKLPVDQTAANEITDKAALQTLVDGVNAKITAAKAAGVTDAEIQALVNHGRIQIALDRIAAL